MDYFIAIDGGGTKTDSVLFDETGRILFRDVTTGCNALDIGVEHSAQTLLGAIHRLQTRAPEKIASVYCGVAGNCHTHRELYQSVRAGVSAEHLQLCDDTYNVISSVLHHQDGCGLVAGTGSSLFVRAEGSPCVHIGGWGYLLDTGGSGYDLGRDALYMALRASDGRGKPTVLCGLLEKELGAKPEASIARIYSGGRPYIASLAHAVFEGRKQNDPVCQEIFDRGAAHLAEMVRCAAQYYSGDYSVVLGGGLFSAHPEYVEALRAKCPVQARLLTTDMPVVYGAAVEALWPTGRTVTEKFQRQFLQDYRLLQSEQAAQKLLPSEAHSG